MWHCAIRSLRVSACNAHGTASDKPDGGVNKRLRTAVAGCKSLEAEESCCSLQYLYTYTENDFSCTRKEQRTDDICFGDQRIYRQVRKEALDLRSVEELGCIRRKLT